jgi:hypothetical protein
MRTTTDKHELGECYCHNIKEIAARNFHLIDFIKEHFSCDCTLCLCAKSDALHMASLHLWFERGGRLAFIDPPEQLKGNK